MIVEKVDLIHIKDVSVCLCKYSGFELPYTLFDGSEGVITKIDYRKERARVDFRFEGNACHTWVAIDGLRKTEGQ